MPQLFSWPILTGAVHSFHYRDAGCLPGREMVAGFVINKFRGCADPKPGIDYLEKRTACRCSGLSVRRNHGIEEEDSVSIWDGNGSGTKKSGKKGKITDLLDIAVINLPRISIIRFQPVGCGRRCCAALCE